MKKATTPAKTNQAAKAKPTTTTSANKTPIKPGAVAKKPDAKVPVQTRTPVAQSAPAQANPPSPVKSEPSLTKIKVKQLLSHIVEDQTGAIKSSGKWALVIDNEQVARTFFKYSGDIYINCGDPEMLVAEKIRIGILGALRYGKGIVFDLEDREVSLWKTLQDTINEIDNGLLESIVSKKILEDENYLKLVKEDQDGDEFQKFYFTEVDKFRFIAITSSENPDKELMNHFTVFKVQSDNAE